ncbi:hypothetical protein DENSPDRAFT_886805 [Dentipellis sp. KUC8613]|nr:hypothetical protein DENSPDRAFT_886805 [Dentipellis sp. KUC8613]
MAIVNELALALALPPALAYALAPHEAPEALRLQAEMEEEFEGRATRGCNKSNGVNSPPCAPEQRRRTVLAASLSLSPPRSPSRRRLAHLVTAPCAVVVPCLP